MITCRFILKSGQHINHNVSPTIARKIHETILKKSNNVIFLEDQWGNTTMTVVVAEIAAYCNID